MKRFDLDLSSSTKSLEHYWELCVGSGHATTALREDYRRQLARCHNEALSASSYMQTETLSFQVDNERVDLELTLPPMGIAAVNLYL